MVGSLNIYFSYDFYFSKGQFFSFIQIHYILSMVVLFLVLWSCDVTQGGTLSPQISNAVVVVIVHHWAGLVADNEVFSEGFKCTVADKADFSYVDDGLFASTNPVWIQWEFDVIINIFYQVGLQTNLSNMVKILCRPEPIAGQQYTYAYVNFMIGKEESHRVVQHRRVVCE